MSEHEDVEAANEAFYRAFEAVDLAAMAGVSSTTTPRTCSRPARRSLDPAPRGTDNEGVSDKRIGLAEVPRWVQSGMRVGVGGGPVMITPTALLHEVIRSGARDLRLVASSTNGFGFDLLIGAGCAGSAEFAQVVLNELGQAPNFRRWAESGRLRCLDHT